MGRFDYILKKIADAPFLELPFRHLQIEDLFAPEDLSEVLESPQVAIGPVACDEELVDRLHFLDFKEITFPGTTTDLKEYFRWHKNRGVVRNSNVETCEGIGVTLRLQRTQAGTILRELNDFFASPVFLGTVARKFGVDRSETIADLGLQKYLDGYEISPHPDIRLKALTYMINVNPALASEELDYHTHYMTFIPSRRYVQAFWEGNPTVDRCWVPWSWCETRKRQVTNNSLVMFKPADDTLHAVKADYDHLVTQRTQFYGNLWYKTTSIVHKPSWRDYEISASDERRNNANPVARTMNRIRSKVRFLFP